MAASAHKFHGPKGIGFVYISRKMIMRLVYKEGRSGPRISNMGSSVLAEINQNVKQEGPLY